MKNSKFNFIINLSYLFIIITFFGCSIFEKESDIETVKKQIILGIIYQPDKVVELINKNPLKGEDFILFKEIPIITFNDEVNLRQISIPFNQLIKESKEVEIYCDYKRWVYSGGGYWHSFIVKCYYKEFIVPIKFTFYFKGNTWYFGSMGYTEIPYCF